MAQKRFFEAPAKHFFNFGWSHGRYLDYWSFVHILTGIIFGTLILIVHSPSLLSFIIIVAGLILYEFLEILAGIAEDIQNSASDVVCGSAGSAFALWILPKFVITHNVLLILSVAIIAN